MYNFSYQNDITDSFWFIQYHIVFNGEISSLAPWVILVDKSVIIKTINDKAQHEYRYRYRFLNKISGIPAGKPVEYRYRYDTLLSFTGNLQVSADIPVSVLNPNQ